MADAPLLLPTDKLKDGYPKINQAINNANEALKPAGSDRIATGAITTPKLADESVTIQKAGQDLLSYMKKAKMDNLLINTDLPDLTNWATVYASNVTTSNGEVTFTPTQRFGQVKQDTNIQSIVGHQYYVGSYVKTTSKNMLLGMCRQSDGSLYGSKTHSGSGAYELLSFVTTTNDVASIQYKLYENGSSGFVPISMKQPIIVDLTNIFGAGKEPTATEFELLLKTYISATYFAGTSYLPINLNDAYRMKYNLINKVVNGNFVNTGYWNFQLANGSIANNEAIFTPTATYGQMWEDLGQSVANNMYYVFASVKSSSNNVKLHLYRSDTGAFFGEAKHSGSGNYENLSFICNADVATSMRTRVIDYRSSGFNEIRAKTIIVVNLTEIFGAGNEPTLSQFEDMLKKNNNNNIFFDTAIPTNILKSDVYTPPNAVNRSMLPIYLSKVGNVIKVNSKYSDTQDMRVTMQKKGPNSIFDFYSFDMVPNTSKTVSSDMLTGTQMLLNGTDFFGPHVVKAVNNINGDLNDGAFTGGNHGFNGGATGTPTGVTLDITICVDGRKLSSDFSGYASFIDIYWTNQVQAYNTKKADGTGRYVLQENYHLHYDGFKWTVRNRIDFLEDVIWMKYYGLQCSNLPWAGSIFYHSSQNRKWNDLALATDSTNTRCNKMTLKKNNDYVEMGLHDSEGIGNKEFLNGVAYGAFSTTLNKSYFFLVNGTNNFYNGESVTYEGYYRFYSK